MMFVYVDDDQCLGGTQKNQEKEKEQLKCN